MFPGNGTAFVLHLSKVATQNVSFPQQKKQNYMNFNIPQ